MKRFALTACLLTVLALALCAEAPAIKLPEPRMEGGKPLMECLKLRKSARQFSDKQLSQQMVSDLLWAAFGVNRSDTGKRTAPSAVNWQEIDIYVAMEGGAYLFDAKAHALTPVLGEDIRAMVGKQGFTQKASVNLIYVADYARMGRADAENQKFYSAADTGFISQNVYLFCASEGLNTVVLGMVDREALKGKLGLRADQHIILTQPVGYGK